MFQPVSSRVSFPELDARVLQLWKDKDVLHRSETERPGAPLFMLFEGPPTANGSPGIHHVLARVFKDVICRHRTMKGFRCLRKGGWDTHGLPVELEVEKELGLKTKRDIEEYGIEEFNRRCRDSVFRYVKEWETLTDRIGYWVDTENAYVTLDNSFIETGWWILKQLWDKGLLYQDLRGTPHCPRCVTSLSSHEVALGYKEDTPDPSVFVKFRVEPSDNHGGNPPNPPFAKGGQDGPGALLFSDTPTYLLAWTTTPWTLPGNTALAVSHDEEYSVVEVVGAHSRAPLPSPVDGDGVTERLVLATKLLSAALKHDYTVVGTLKGADLVGVRYEPLYSPAAFGAEIRQFQRREGPSGTVVELGLATEFAPSVVSAGFVSMEDGSGIVHIAPAFGDEDLTLGREKGLAFVQPVDLQGIVTGSYPFAGKFVKQADPLIMRELQERGLLYRRDVYKHTYPFCWRCDTPLLYYAKSSWYIRTTAVKDKLVSGNQAINWYPEYIQEGRFGEWLRNNVDWAISRERYWGTPIPIWQCPECRGTDCFGSVAELRERVAPRQRGKLKDLDLHRPYVDDIHLRCSTPECAGQMRRIPEVMDAWFDSGAMPYAQWHYPFDNDTIATDGRFPADYICEAVDQTRGWFYSLHALGTLLFDQPAYRNVICLGLILDEKGRKMSKRVGNVVAPLGVLDAHGADALRWYLFTASQPGEPRRFSDRLVQETLRRVLLTLWNVYSFFTNYASIDRFHPSQIPAGWKPDNELDRWVLSELNVLVGQVDDYLEHYNPTDAGRRLQEFIDHLSNWYVRRSRRRFWKPGLSTSHSSEGDTDKLSGYATLYTCLETVARLMAPLAPFVAEEMYQNLVRSVNPSAPDSVHLAQFPVADESLVDQPLMEATRLAMRICSMGRAARAKAGLKVRQPLADVAVLTRNPQEAQALGPMTSQILEELNVKELRFIDAASDLYQKVIAATTGRMDAVMPGMRMVDGYMVNHEDGYLVAVNTVLTSDLRDEGMVRELVHRIQNLRRDAGFEITDRIITYYQGPAEIDRVLRRHAEYVQQETLSDKLVAGAPPEGASAEAQKVEGMEVTLGVRRV
ncbi:MAG: isoleucine--tRNA ligase [Dehalococcoidia bacterium]|nr:isoleucine--tRNA ligase [Dehalococcoidia bacterium]